MQNETLKQIYSKVSSQAKEWNADKFIDRAKEIVEKKTNNYSTILNKYIHTLRPFFSIKELCTTELIKQLYAKFSHDDDIFNKQKFNKLISEFKQRGITDENIKQIYKLISDYVTKENKRYYWTNGYLQQINREIVLKKISLPYQYDEFIIYFIITNISEIENGSICYKDYTPYVTEEVFNGVFDDVENYIGILSTLI